MRRILFALFALAAVGALGYFLGRPGNMPAQPAGQPAPSVDVGAPSPPLDKMEVSVPEVEVRSAPGSKYYATNKLFLGDRVQAVRQEGDFVAIKPPPGSISWINAEKVLHNPQHSVSAVIGNDPVPVRPGGEMENNPLVESVKVSPGTLVVVTGKEVVKDNVAWVPIQPVPSEVRYLPLAALRPVPADAAVNRTKPAVSLGVPATLDLKSTAQQLPIKRIILFSNGVAYVQREGQVDGNARVDLSFPQQNINDLLKSMVVEDLGGGSISTVSFDSHDPVAKTLKSFALDLNDNPSLAHILVQARGEKIEVTLKKSEKTVTGSVIGIEPLALTTDHYQRVVPALASTVVAYRKPLEDAATPAEVLNLSCADGIHSIKLADVERLRFLNPTLDADFKRALDVLATSHDTQKKSVSLNFTGEGKRKVRVGYVVENPLWRTSYRLMANKDGKLFLQGWAVVENTSTEDWKDVSLSLVSGQPISFHMDLYQPLYAARPVVQPELFGNIRPVVYGGSMAAANQPGQNGRLVPVAEATPTPTAAPASSQPMGQGAGQEMRTGPLRDFQYFPQPGTPQTAQVQGVPNQYRMEQGGYFAAVDGVWWQSSVKSAAKAVERGDFFQYDIQHPVTLPRQKSAMLPIVNKAIGGAKVSIYNEATHAKYPFFGLQLQNNTGLHLTQGPVAVFDGGSYAGDAQMLDLQPKEDRLISYAVDLGTEVEPLAKNTPAHIMSVKVHKGVIHCTVKARESKTYNVKNRSAHERMLLVEHPFRADFELVSKTKPKERSRDAYRFEVKVAAGKTASLEVVEEREVKNEAAITNMNDQFIVFLETNVKSAKAKEVFQKAVKLRESVSGAHMALAVVERQLNDITQDQARLRANLAQMPQSAVAYKRYLEKFDKQETEIERLQTAIKELRDGHAAEQRRYEQFLLSLTLETTPVGAAEGVALPEEPPTAIRMPPPTGYAPPAINHTPPTAIPTPPSIGPR